MGRAPAAAMSLAYSASGATSVRPHAVINESVGTQYSFPYAYDANGNLLSDGRRTFNYASFNLPLQITRGTWTLDFLYDGDYRRVRKTGPSGAVFYFDSRDDTGVRYEQHVTTNGAITHRHYLYAGDRMVGVVARDSSGTTQTRYFHTDRLGSITAITNESGTVVERLAYNPWGKRRQADGTTDTAGTLVGQTTPYGFTGEEHLDEVGLIHLNGRIYNPEIGRFTSADPFVPDWTNSQSFNRYSYVRNNPLKYVDPSGFTEGVADFGSSLNVWGMVPRQEPTTPFGCCTATEWKLAGTTAGPPGGGSELSFYASDPWRNNGVSYQPLSGGAIAISGGSPTQVTATTTTTTTSTGGTTTTSVTYTVTQCSGACNTPPPPPATLGPTISFGSSGATVNAFSPFAVSPVTGFLLGILFPPYDLARAIADPNSTAFDYVIGIAGIIPGVGKAGGLAATGVRTIAERALPALRAQYVSAVEVLATRVPGMRQAGMNSEQIARALHAERRALGEQFKALTPADKLAEITQRNIQRYGDPLGPSIDWLRAQGRSWEQIIESASRAGGRDLGF